MDEFGQQSPTDQDGSGQQPQKPADVVPPTKHEVKKPLSSTVPASRFDHRVAPFADLDTLPQQQQSEKEEGSGGCCKCIIM